MTNRVLILVFFASLSGISATSAAANPAYTYLHMNPGLVVAAKEVVVPTTIPAGSVYATLDPSTTVNGVALSADKLTAWTGNTGMWNWIRPSTGKTSGKWYWEVSFVAGNSANYGAAGIGSANFRVNHVSWPDTYGATQAGYNLTAGPGRAFTWTPTVGDTLMYALDLDTKKLTIGRNGQWPASGTTAAPSFEAAVPAYIGLPSGVPLYPVIAVAWSARLQANFGATPFKYAPPAGYMQGWW